MLTSQTGGSDCQRVAISFRWLFRPHPVAANRSVSLFLFNPVRFGLSSRRDGDFMLHNVSIEHCPG